MLIKMEIRDEGPNDDDDDSFVSSSSLMVVVAKGCQSARAGDGELYALASESNCNFVYCRCC